MYILDTYFNGVEAMQWDKILAVVAGAIMLFFLVRVIKTKPKAFTKENFFKSSYTLAILALLLIVFVAFCVLLLRSSA